VAIQSIKFEGFELDCGSYELRRNGRNEKLERLPMNLLILLATKHDRLVSREEIEEHLWRGRVYVDSNLGINTAIRKIRQALHDDSDCPRFIQTIAGRGYKFVATITEIVETPTVEAPVIDEVIPFPPEAAIATLPLTQVATESAREAERTWVTRTNHWSRFLIPGLAFAGLCGVIAMLWLWKPSSSRLKVTGTVQLTTDGRSKGGNLVSDGSRLYFNEVVADRTVLAAVPVSGGEPVIIPSPFQDTSLIAVTNDKSQLLVSEGKLIGENSLWLLPVLGGPPRRLADVVAHAASWSPDGRQLVYARGSELYLAKADGTEPHRLVTGNPDPKVWAWWPRWSHDSGRVRFTLYHMNTHASALWEVTVNGRNLHQLLLSSDNSAMQCCGEWTVDGGSYLFNSWNNLVATYTRPEANLWGIREKSGGLLQKGTAEPFQITVGPMRFFGYTLDPSRNVIYSTSSQDHGQLLRYDLNAKRVVPYLSGMSAEGLSFSPDGAWVAYVKFPHGELWRSRTNGREALQLSSRPLITTFPSWSPDGSRIAFSGQSVGQEWQLYVVPANGGPPQLLPGSAEGYAPTWSPEGTALAFYSNTFNKIRVIHLNNLQISDFPGAQGFSAPQWSRDGRYMAALSDKGKLMLFDFKTEKWSDWVTNGNLDFPRWSRDGKSIYVTDSGDDLSVLRVALGEHTPRKVVDLHDIQFVRPNTPWWFSLTPDDEPLLLRDTGGGSEIYAQQWSIQ
jgi:Tol biopolymer transport system component/DNA-binding winged helix-turn-helix (wHTH) protein